MCRRQRKLVRRARLAAVVRFVDQCDGSSFLSLRDPAYAGLGHPVRSQRIPSRHDIENHECPLRIRPMAQPASAFGALRKHDQKRKRRSRIPDHRSQRITQQRNSVRTVLSKAIQVQNHGPPRILRCSGRHEQNIPVSRAVGVGRQSPQESVGPALTSQELQPPPDGTRPSRCICRELRWDLRPMHGSGSGDPPVCLDWHFRHPARLSHHFAAGSFHGIQTGGAIAGTLFPRIRNASHTNPQSAQQNQVSCHQHQAPRTGLLPRFGEAVS